jgi:heptaprenyl diphosphate synthase
VKNKTIARYGLMTALMLILGFLESRIPFPVPGIKLGLANTVLLYALYILGGKAALVLMALKVILSGLSFSGLSAMMYSAAGSALSLGLMALFKHTGGFSVLGVSVIGAVGHNAGQLLMACIITSSLAPMAQLPLLLVSAVLTGIATGMAARLTVKHLCGRNI